MYMYIDVHMQCVRSVYIVCHREIQTCTCTCTCTLMYTCGVYIYIVCHREMQTCTCTCTLMYTCNEIHVITCRGWLSSTFPATSM